MIKIAINGYGRIGRNTLRALYESGRNKDISIVAINDLAPANVNAHLTQFDSVHGQFSQKVSLQDDVMLVGHDEIKLLQERDPANLPWAQLGVDIVLECTGLFTSREAAAKHLEAGAKKVILSAPGTDMDATVVHGVNDEVLNAQCNIISNASCTTNCLAPVAKALNDAIGIEQGSMTTIHSYTNDQNLSDVYHKDLYRARSATQSMIPTKTGAAKAVGLVLPELAGKLDGMAVRVPTINVSLVDLTFIAKRETSIDEVNATVKAASEGVMAEVLAYNELPLVSIDFNHNPASSVFDATQTRVDGKLVKVMAWYDNEWGFSNRMLDQVQNLAKFL
ncbi:type I glyceraldehyde-3-phosphate dehydrogenase [Pseudoalteromonas sp. YIC-827]|uniref:Glyceraldehyde-3-phosphate dehydrogenase n=1 Tax=Pseudoalteromonas qingdaonensis TaxID=3131913 RepID=A0ABU9MWR8_9GAMM